MKGKSRNGLGSSANASLTVSMYQSLNAFSSPLVIADSVLNPGINSSSRGVSSSVFEVVAWSLGFIKKSKGFLCKIQYISSPYISHISF